MIDFETAQQDFDRDGFVALPGLLDPQVCLDAGNQYVEFHRRLIASGWQFHGGGRLMGHLNFTSGVPGKAIWDRLKDLGVPQLAERLLGRPLILDNCIGNLNLPGSKPQELHQDSRPPGEDIGINVTLVPTTIENGATELLPGTQGDRFTYKTLHRNRARLPTYSWESQPGDVLIRRATVWHRGTSNRSDHPRPLLTYPMLTNPADHADIGDDSQIAFYGNRYYGTGAKLREAAEYRAPMAFHLMRMMAR